MTTRSNHGKWNNGCKYPITPRMRAALVNIGGIFNIMDYLSQSFLLLAMVAADRSDNLPARNREPSYKAKDAYASCSCQKHLRNSRRSCSRTRNGPCVTKRVQY
jgi:hypothetical protein